MAHHCRARRHASRAQDALTEEQLDALLGVVSIHTTTGKRNLALMLVMADAGLRVSEATGLRTTDVVSLGDEPTHVDIRYGKGGRPGRVALTARAADAVGAWIDTRGALGLRLGPLFCTISSGTAGGHWARDGQALEPGRPVSTEYARQLVHRLARRAGSATASRTVDPTPRRSQSHSAITRCRFPWGGPAGCNVIWRSGVGRHGSGSPASSSPGTTTASRMR